MRAIRGSRNPHGTWGRSPSLCRAGAGRATLGVKPHPFQENSMVEFLVEGMSCGHCVNVVTEAIHTLDPVATVDVDLGTKRVRVASDVDPFLLSQTLKDAGYDPVPVGLPMPDHI
jgi:copper chaperone